MLDYMKVQAEPTYIEIGGVRTHTRPTVARLAEELLEQYPNKVSRSSLKEKYGEKCLNVYLCLLRKVLNKHGLDLSSGRKDGLSFVGITIKAPEVPAD